MLIVVQMIAQADEMLPKGENIIRNSSYVFHLVWNWLALDASKFFISSEFDSATTIEPRGEIVRELVAIKPVYVKQIQGVINIADFRRVPLWQFGRFSDNVQQGDRAHVLSNQERVVDDSVGGY